ncbi:MAG: branched-chain amino acid ABC transporter substrate-binding protein [Syntrophaceae bacterium]|nr:branched-chain amino acid ABC transporter substrate-binding protein [Syntrophaceae bacterium]
MKKVFFYLLIFIFMMSSSVFAADNIKIGLMAPITGAWSNTGQEMKLVIDLLAEDINAKGGILGKKIEVVTVNDEGTPQGASQAADELVKQSVTAVIGSLISVATEASQITFDKAKILQITNASTAVTLTEKNLKYFFRTCPRDDEQSRVIAQTIRKMKLKKIAILYDKTAPYAVSLASDVRKHTKKEHIDIVFDGPLDPGLEDYVDILNTIKSKNPDLVFFAGYYVETANLLRKKKDMDWKVVFIGGDGANNPDLITMAGKTSAEGFYFISPPLPGELITENANKFILKFKEKNGYPPRSIDSILAGDAFRVIINAIGETKSTDPDILANHLHSSFVDESGLTGRINFNAKGDRMTDLYGVYRVDAGGRFIVQRIFQYGEIVK